MHNVFLYLKKQTTCIGQVWKQILVHLSRAFYMYESLYLVLFLIAYFYVLYDCLLIFLTTFNIAEDFKDKAIIWFLYFIIILPVIELCNIQSSWHWHEKVLLHPDTITIDSAVNHAYKSSHKVGSYYRPRLCNQSIMNHISKIYWPDRKRNKNIWQVIKVLSSNLATIFRKLMKILELS